MLTQVHLDCGHVRRVEDGILRMIRAGHITEQSCLVCRAPAQVAAFP